MNPIAKSNKLANVAYDIRGPVLDKARQMEEEGQRIIKLNIGNVAAFGLMPPDEIVQDMIHNLHTATAAGYTDSKGLFAPRKAVVHYTQQKNVRGVGIDDVYLGNGASELIAMGMNALLNDGDEVLIPSPDYPLYTAVVGLSGGTPVHYRCDESSGWMPDIEHMRSMITPRTRALVVINPNNPTGALYADEVLLQIVEVARQHQLIVFADEIYDKTLFDGHTHTSISSLADDVLFVTVNGLSKNYRSCGYRSGWMVVSGEKRHARDYIEGLNMLASLRLCANTPGQLAIQTALGGYQSINDLVAPTGRLCRQRDLAYSLLTQIPGVSVVKPKAALYMFPRLDPKLYPIADDQQFAYDLLADEKVLIVQGTGFNWSAPDHFRIVFLPNSDDLTEAIMRIERFLSNYRKRAFIVKDGMMPIQVGLLGIGTVGSGTFNVLRRNQEEIRRRAGRGIHITMVADLDTERARSVVGSEVQVVSDARQVIANPAIDIVVELIGGYGIARTLVLEAIAAGKHVVTANKALLAVHGSEIFAAARDKGVVVAFEAAVAGGIPIIKALREGLTANRIEWVAGIINGTTNFILSEMRSKGLDFGVVLQQAQQLGYAEADPTFDIEGVDAAHKATIMSAIAFGVPVQFSKAHVEGITALQAADIRYAEQLGYRIKLLGITKRRDDLKTAAGGVGGIELRVHPTLVPSTRLLANVEGAMNAVVVHGDAVGTTLYYGKGAGSEPTASAVVADLVDITRLHTADPGHRVPHLAFQHADLQDTPILGIDEVITAFYLRLVVADKAGVLARITGILAEHDISIDAVLQRESADGEKQTDLIILTHDTVEGRMKAALAQMQALPTVLAPIVRIRKEELS